MNDLWRRGVYWLCPDKYDFMIFDPTGLLIDRVTSERLGKSIVDELNSIQKPTEKQLDTLIDLIQENTGNAFGIRRWAEEQQ